MKSSTGTERRAMGFLVGACYLLSVALCGVAAHGLMQLMVAAAGGVASEFYTLAGSF